MRNFLGAFVVTLALIFIGAVITILATGQHC